MTDNPWRLLTITEAAGLLGVEPNAVVKIATDAGVHQVMVGWQHRYKLRDVLALAERRREVR